MTKESFIGSIRASLAERNIPEQFITRQCEILEKKINDLPADKSEKYLVESNASLLIDKLARKYENEASMSADPEVQEPIPAVNTAGSEESSAVNGQPDEQLDPTPTVLVDIPEDVKEEADPEPAKSSEDLKVEPKIESDIVVVFDDNDKKKNKSLIGTLFSSEKSVYADNAHPRLLFGLILLLLAPVGLLIVTAVFGAYVGIFAALAGVIIVVVAAVVIIAGVGSLISVASILYGVTQAISSPRYVGIHEIGFGLLVGGITLFVSIVLYNLALRLVPFLYAKLVQFLKFSYRITKKLFRKSMKGCEKL